MQTDVKTAHLTASGTAFNGRTRLKSVSYRGNGTDGYIKFRDGGSSGSPCFDESWNLVALHHAQINRLFGAVRGSIRQGILFNSIYEEIKSYL